MDTIRQLHVLGVSFRSAPLAVRESLSFDSQQSVALLRGLAPEVPGLEAAVLSTCNRTEFYLVSGLAHDPKAALFRILKRLRPQAAVFESDCHHYVLSDREAVCHLFRVACGLESAVLGDIQILSQLKACRQDAETADTLGKQLHKAIDLAINAGQRARTETQISFGNAGIGSAIVEVLDRYVRALSTNHLPRILIVGAGDVAAAIARQISNRRSASLVFINRTVEWAQRLAVLYGGETREWSTLPASLAQADAIVAATSAKQPVLTREMLDHAARSHGGQAQLFVDAGMPRNIEPDASANVVNIDDIRQRHREILRTRHTAVPLVKSLIDQQLNGWMAWRDSLPVDDIVKSLYLELDSHQTHSMQELIGRQRLCPGELQELIFRPMRRIMHQHVVRLRSMNSLASGKSGHQSCAHE